jgi:hypothetical protein
MKTLTFLTTGIVLSFAALPAYGISFTFNSVSVSGIETVNNPIDVSGVTGISAVSFSINGSTGDLGGLSIYLQNPARDKTLLLATNLGSGTTFTANVSFSDSNSLGLGNIDTNSSPYSGDFLPFDSNLDGDGNPIANINTFGDFSPNSDGNWNLKLINSTISIASIGESTLTFQSTPVPFEFNPASGLLILGGAWLVRKTLKNKNNKI